MIGKIRWIITGICFAFLKNTLRYRLKDDSAQWQQPLPFLKNNIVNREDFITNLCKDKSVLHIGFTDYPYTKEKIQHNNLLHTKIKGAAKLVFGIDNNQASIDEYIKLSSDTQVAFTDILKEYPAEVLRNKYEVIVLAEVLEHLPNPSKAIDLIAKTFQNNISILVTVPNYTSLDSISASLNKTESIHPHHYWYFSPYTLHKLFSEHGFVCEEMCFGMYYNSGIKPNPVLQNNSFTGDCIIAVFKLTPDFKNEQ